MKVVYKFLGAFLLAFSAISCFDQPNFPATPEIVYNDLEFREVGGFSDPDSLVLKISFKDGDGDLGINKIVTTDGQAIDNINDPFHDSNFFLFDGTGVPKAIGTQTFYTDTLQNGIAEFVPLKIFNAGEVTGKLLTRKNQANYGDLPPFNVAKKECLDYTLQNLFVFKDDWRIIDNSYYIKDTLRDAFGNDFIYLKDTVYFETNPNHYNIEVDFFVKDPTVGNSETTLPGFREFDWRKEFCTTYDGRFSRLSDTDTPLDGILTYSMASTGFRTVFSVKTLKLRISIKDRALNVSNVILTPEFTLDGIKR